MIMSRVVVMFLSTMVMARMFIDWSVDGASLM
jgi:hypothetical protein